MNSLNYFSHDTNARNNSKILKLRMKYGAAGYGVYFMILERLREESNYMSVKDYNTIAFDLRVDASLVKAVVEDFGLFAFTENGECFYSESFNRRMSIENEKKKEISRKRAEAGKKGLEKRWKRSCDNIANDSKTVAFATKVIANANSKIIANDCKKEKEKEKEIPLSPHTPLSSKEKEKEKEKAENIIPRARKIFKPPTISEIQNYIAQKGYHVDAELFFNFYESKGWFVGKNKMTSWHAAVATWQRSNNRNYGSIRNNNQQGNETSHRGETDAEFQARIYRQVLNSQPKQDECDGTEPF